MNNRAVGIKRRGRARGNSHLSSGAEGAKGEGRRQSRGKHDQINVARKKDGDGQTDGNADVCTRTVGRGRRPQNRWTTGRGAVRRQAGGTAEISRGAPYLIPDNGVARSVPTLEGDPKKAKNFEAEI